MGVLPVWASAMARVMALLEMALFLWLVSDTSSSLGREGEGFPPPPMLIKAAAWFLKQAAAWENTSACEGRERGREGGREGGRKGGREGGREGGGREGGKEGGREGKEEEDMMDCT